MDEEVAYDVLNKHQIEYYQEDGQFVIKYKYYPFNRKGKEFLKAFNLIFGHHGKEIVFNEISYRVINGRYDIKSGDFFGRWLGPHYGKGYLREISQVNVTSEGTVSISANQVTIYSDIINQIKAERFIYTDELTSSENTELLDALNLILEELQREQSPSDKNLIVLKKIARSTSELAGFAANIITILGSFL